MTELLAAAKIENGLFGLLREWCDALVRLQIDKPDDASLHGGILCPACKMIHGRCHEAAYPLLAAARRTGEKKYLDAARKLFAWGGNMLCPDGAVRNDAKSDWKGVTAFAAIALHDALFFHGGLLGDAERGQWEARLADMGRWLYKSLTVGARAYINYYAANACAMALLGRYFDIDAYRAAARELADYCFAHRSGSGLLYGEGSPHDTRTPKGCLAIDFGYNAEESLPCLCRYADTADDADAMEKCRRMYDSQLVWMLPDGAWDDSMGTRSFKWSYWGSRTADGCQDALFRLGRKDPVFAEAAWRNFELLRRCTHGGLLAGGSDYAENGEEICVHHTFCHAKTLAASLDAGTYAFLRTALPAQTIAPLLQYEETDTYRISDGEWIADITAYDARYKRGGHISGGSVSLLWHRRCGAAVAAGMAAFSLFEPFNQQIPRDPDTHRSPCPRIEADIGGKTFAQHFDYAASMRAETEDGAVKISVRASLCDIDGVPLPEDGGCLLTYILCGGSFRIKGSVAPARARQSRYILPIVSDSVAVSIQRGSMPDEPKRIFSPAPGFRCREWIILPDADGCFDIQLTVQNT